MGPDGSTSLAQHLLQLTHLSKLILGSEQVHTTVDHNNMGAKGGNQLGATLPEISTLRYLDLGKSHLAHTSIAGNGIGVADCKGIVSAFKVPPQPQPVHQGHEPQEVREVLDALILSTKCGRPLLGDNGLDDSIAAQIQEILKVNSIRKCLDLSMCKCSYARARQE